MDTFTYEWIDYYNTFAKKLLSYKNNRKALIELIKNVYAEICIKLPTLETGNNIIDIDNKFSKFVCKEINFYKKI